MRIIGIDPGYDRCGIALVERNVDGSEQLLASGCIVTNRKDAIETRLVAIVHEFRSWIEKYAPQLCAIERLYFTSNQKTAMRVAEVRGALIVAAHERNVAVEEYGPNEIKVAIAGDGRATKQQIMLMVPQLIHIEHEIPYDDEYDAIAVALTASASTRTTYQDS